MGVEILSTPEGRQQVIQEIQANESRNRKITSLRQFEVYRGNLYRYVFDYLSRQFQPNTLKEIPVVASINIAKRVVDQEASIYNKEPTRDWTDLDDNQLAVMEDIYADSEVNTKLAYANAMFKLQSQTTLMIVPKDGEIDIRCLKNHQVDVIPNNIDPSKADAYIISSFDKQNSFYRGGQDYNAPFNNADFSDLVNQAIGDQEDYKSTLNKYLVWTETENYVMDGRGNIIGEVLPNPIGCLPFIDISGEKDYEFWNRVASTTVDFCIEYNAALSMQNQVVKMQGFAQAWMKGTKDVMPNYIQVGPSFILHLVKGKDVDGNVVDTEFGYSNPQPDLAGSKEHLEMLLANFLSAKGLDTSAISSGKGGGQKFSSGVERLLSMIEAFEASRSDFSIFRCVEEDVYEIIKAWHNAGALDPEYTSGQISEESDVQVSFKSPEMIQTEAEKLANIQLKEELGVASKVDSIMAVYEMTRDEALEKQKQIEEDNAGSTQQIPIQNPQGIQSGDTGGSEGNVSGSEPIPVGQEPNSPTNN